MPIWVDGTSGDWGTSSNWSGDVVPTGVDNAAIAGTGTGTETVTVSSSEAANLLTLDDANATLKVENYATLSAFDGLTMTAILAIEVTSGVLLFGGGSETLDGGTIDLGVRPLPGSSTGIGVSSQKNNGAAWMVRNWSS